MSVTDLRTARRAAGAEPPARRSASQPPRVDLLSPERSNSARAVSALLHSVELRTALLVPVLAMSAVLGYNLYQHSILDGINRDITVQQEHYRFLRRDEQRAQLRVQNYQALLAVARKLFALRRSVVDQAVDIVNIGNVVYSNKLRLTSISEKGQTNEQWDLVGQTTDQSNTTTCFNNVAKALPQFVKIAHVASAVPSNSRGFAATDGGSGVTQVPVCTYKVRLDFDQRTQDGSQ